MDAIIHANAMLLLGAGLVLAGILSSLIATRFGAPMLLFFLAIGMLAGEEGPGGIQFSNYELAYQIGSLALAVILFDGGLNTRTSRFRRALAPALMLATVGVLITAALAGGLAIWVLHLRPIEGFLVGAVVASTDAAAVFFLLRSGGLQLKSHVGATLEIESGTNDPFAVFLTLGIITVMAAGQDISAVATIVDFLWQTILGLVLGLAGGLAVVALLNRVEFPAGLHPLLVMTSAVVIYGFTMELGGSGFLGVYLAGLVVGNRPVRAFASITSWHEAVTWLAQLVMFVMLGLLVTPSKLVLYAPAALLIALFLIFVARPAAVWLCLAPFGFDWREKLFVGWVGLRGAVSIFLSAIPVLGGLPNAEVYFNVAFFVVLVSLLLQGWTIRVAARRLDQAGPRKTAQVSRIELDLPGQLELEMVGYPIVTGSPVLMMSGLPGWARPTLVVRDGAILEPAEAGTLRIGDYAYLLAPPLRVRQLDRLFATAAAAARPSPAGFVGEFPIRGDVPIAQLAELYGLTVTPEERSLTVAELFDERFESSPETGDGIALGPATLVARALDGDQVARAGLQWPDEETIQALMERTVADWRPKALLKRWRQRQKSK
jgi:cell volume regulation protein A